MNKKYERGMFGGKFCPFHKGHLHCLEVAASECEIVFLILFHGGKQEMDILSEPHERYLDVDIRMQSVRRAAQMFNNVIPVFIDISSCKLPDGSEDWDAETPLVIEVCGGSFDAVYGSEPQYADYFARAYPECTYRLVDAERKHVPISGTVCRKMNKNERERWMI